MEKERRSDCESLENLAGKPRRKKKKKEKAVPSFILSGIANRYDTKVDLTAIIIDFILFYFVSFCFFFLSFFLFFLFFFVSETKGFSF